MGGLQTRLGPVRTTVSLERYQGVWYEVARSKAVRFEPAGTTDVRSTYTINAAGRFEMRTDALLNGQSIWWENMIVRILNDYNSHFQLSPNSTSVGISEYRIIGLDFDQYQWAIVASGEVYGWVWILSRQREITDDFFLKLTDRLDTEYGFDPRQLVRTLHTQPSLEVQQQQPPPATDPVQTYVTADGMRLTRRTGV